MNAPTGGALSVVDQRDPTDYVWTVKDAYTANAKTYHAFLTDHGLGLLDGLAPYFAFLEGEGYRASTVRIKRQAAIDRLRKAAAIPGATASLDRARLEWKIAEVVNENKSPRMASLGVGREKVLTAEECERTMAACKSERQRAFLQFLYHTGCRVSEMRGIRLVDVKVMAGTAYIVVLGKGRKERTVRVPEARYDAIRAVFNGSTYLFETSTGRQYPRQYISGELRKLTARAIGRPLSAHKLRHSFASRKLAQGVPIDALSRYLGHSNVTTTLSFYAHNEITDSQLFDETW